MKKKIGYTLLIIFAILLLVGSVGIWKFNNTIFKEKTSYLNYTSESKSIHFDWAGDSIGGIYEAQAAMIIPLKIEGLAHLFYMQFDTGSPYSFIYERDLKSLRNLGLDIKEVVKDEERYVEHLELILGDNRINTSMLKIYPNYGHTFDKNDTISRIGIGTIGSDFMVDRITAIDFKNKNIQFFQERPEWMNNLPEFEPFDFTGRRIMLPVILDNNGYEFLYDSGCSAFGLITIKSRYEKYSINTSEEIQYDAKSWKTSLPIRSKTTDELFEIGNTKLKLKRVSYLDMYTAIQPIVTPFTRIGGWLGNQPFNEHMLILDTRQESFNVIKK